MPIRTCLPLIASTTKVMSLPTRTFSPVFLVSTSMAILSL
jgi:hypothetical protein